MHPSFACLRNTFEAIAQIKRRAIRVIAKLPPATPYRNALLAERFRHKRGVRKRRINANGTKMRKALKYTLRLHDHVGAITSAYFGLRAPYFEQTRDEDHDSGLYRRYLQDLIIDRVHYSDLTPDQKYLHDLGSLASPALLAYQMRLSLANRKPRTGNIRASSNLEDSCQRLSLAVYSFKERLKMFGDSLVAIVADETDQRYVRGEVGKIVRRYELANKRIIRYRNFIVHGPKGRLDEFADLRSWELAGIFLHSDLWLDYNNAFEEVRESWKALGQSAVASMEEAIASIQLLNENLISRSALCFLRRATWPQS